MGTFTPVETLDHTGQFDAYVAEPAGQPKAAVIVMQEIFGVNPGIRAKADFWASQGYLALAPDIFWRVAPRVEFDPDVPEQFQQAVDNMMKVDVASAIRDIEALIRHARAKLGGGRGKVGITGYCFGGRLAYLTATRTDIDASVGYYGGGIDGALNESHAIANPLLLHFAGADHFITPEAVAKIHAALDGNSHVRIHEYPGVDHGFATTSGSRRVEDAAQLADGRTAAFFGKHLG